MPKKVHPASAGFIIQNLVTTTTSRGEKSRLVRVPTRAHLSSRLPKPKTSHKHPRTDQYNPDPTGFPDSGLGPDIEPSAPTINEGIFQKHSGKSSQGKTTHEYMDEWGRTKCMPYLDRLILAEAKRSEECENPLHRIERWEETHWVPAWLWQVGTVIFLGHGNLPCPCYRGTREQLESRCIGINNIDDFASDPTYGAKPQRSAVGSGSIITVVHTNGFHHLPTFPCFCVNALSEDLQYLDKGFYPASWKKISTVFTFQVLKTVHLYRVHAHVSNETFTEILRRLTNYIFPGTAPNRKRELARVWQQWNHLINLKRNGFGHVRPGSKPDVGDLALFCPACPQPDVNLPSGWEEDPDQWKFRRYLVADGNFVLNHSIKKKSQDTVDSVWLTDGAGYMVERESYQEHLAIGREYQEPPTCYEHRAVADKNKAKKGYDSTGLVAIACARHGCFAPGGVVDMQKGERQVNVDYALCHAIHNTGGTTAPGVLLAYDINCQYAVNFRKRVNRAPHLQSLLPATVPISFVIGLFHVHGHKDECLSRFAATYLPGAGVTSGEILESLWSTLNGAANTTRSMTLAHRSEMLDACMADSNWRKLQGMVSYLIKQYRKSKQALADAEESFRLLDGTLSEDQRVAWQAEMDLANGGRDQINNTSMDIYNVKTTRVIPMSDVCANLMEEENSENEHIGIADWVTSGIELQEEQIRFLSQLRTRPPAPITSGKKGRAKAAKRDIGVLRSSQALLKRMNSFYETADELFAIDVRTLVLGKWKDEKEECVCEGDESDECFCDIVREDAALRAEAADELTPIPLPSGLQKLPKGWKRVARFEVKLRVAQANEALEGVREYVAQKSWLYRANRGLAGGKRERTRGYDAIKEVDKALRYHMKRYHAARWALDRLGKLQDHPQFRPLTRTHTQAVTSVYDPNKDKPTKEPLSWIWTVNSDIAGADRGHIAELYRVNWIRAKSRQDRWKEELTMVESEMDWFRRWTEYRENEVLGWTSLGLGAGPDAYAYRQADMWARVRSDALQRFATRDRPPKKSRARKARKAETSVRPDVAKVASDGRDNHKEKANAHTNDSSPDSDAEETDPSDGDSDDSDLESDEGESDASDADREEEDFD
ncbi:hypothetical protein DFP72DRAFT_851846 [Ephemerocybe angulata]|uniref:CxC2-like cysteine cluster KDZ transposase-associated domain-containing protein n=1 Tax=Ephemerocybe angulata TaxID=980116 RepID=A0A8H6M1T8_9AGAR|nr:hypothetical protein DFP72DRAFT_851846 [Tulosesus angulatus]